MSTEYFTCRQTIPAAELYGLQPNRIVDKDIVRGGVRRWFATKVRRYRGQATVGIEEPVLGAGASQAYEDCPVRGEHERVQRSSDHGRGGAERSSQVHRCVSTSGTQSCRGKWEETEKLHPSDNPCPPKDPVTPQVSSFRDGQAG